MLFNFRIEVPSTALESLCENTFRDDEKHRPDEANVHNKEHEPKNIAHDISIYVKKKKQ